MIRYLNILFSTRAESIAMNIRAITPMSEEVSRAGQSNEKRPVLCLIFTIPSLLTGNNKSCLLPVLEYFYLLIVSGL